MRSFPRRNIMSEGLSLATLSVTEVSKLARQESPAVEEIDISDLAEGTIIRVRIPNSERVYFFKILNPGTGNAYFVRWNQNKPSKLELYRIGTISSPVLRRGETLDFENQDVAYSLPIKAMSVLYV